MANAWQMIQPQATALDLGFLHLQWYGIIMTGAIVIGFWLARRSYRQKFGNDQLFLDAVFWTVVWGIIGARIFHVFIFQWWYYSQRLSEIFQIWQGGIAIQGGVVFGLVFLWIYSRRKKFSLWQYTDFLVPSVALGQFIGRWGNFFNQELYGSPSHRPWAIFISPERRLAGYEAFSTFHPVFLYESILNLILFSILWGLRKKFHVGQLTAIYFVGYGLIRFATAFYKIDPHPYIGGLRLAQWVAVMFIIVGVSLFVIKNRVKIDTKDSTLANNSSL